MEKVLHLFELVFYAIICGLLGIFYRNCLKMKNMIFNPIYFILYRWAKGRNKFLRFISFSLGYCIYCSTTWISIIAYLILYQKLSLEILIFIAISHIIVYYFCKTYPITEEFEDVKIREKCEDYNCECKEALMKYCNMNKDEAEEFENKILGNY